MIRRLRGNNEGAVGGGDEGRDGDCTLRKCWAVTVSQVSQDFFSNDGVSAFTNTEYQSPFPNREIEVPFEA